MIWKLLWLFLIYSFAGWVLETVLASLKQKKFANRGIINGPFCLIYIVIIVCNSSGLQVCLLFRNNNLMVYKST